MQMMGNTNIDSVMVVDSTLRNSIQHDSISLSDMSSKVILAWDIM